MATIKNIVRANPLSAYSTVAPQGGAAIWAGLSDALGSIYSYMEPGLIDEMKRQGAEAGYDAARRRVGETQTQPAVDAQPVAGVVQNPTAFNGVPASLIRTESGGDFTVSNDFKNGHFGRL